MATILENSSLQLIIDPAGNDGWSLHGGRDGSPIVRDAQLGASYRLGYRRQQGMPPWKQAEISDSETVESVHGPTRQLHINLGRDRNGLEYSLTFALPEGLPLLLWRLKVENRGQAPAQIDRLDLFKAGKLGFPTQEQPTPPDLAFLSNGWQSWSYSGVYGGAERQRRTRLGLLQGPVNINPETPCTRRAGHFSSDMFAVLGDRKSRAAILAGFLSQRQHFGSLEAWTDAAGFGLQMWANGDQAQLDSGAEITTDWACLAIVDADEAQPLGTYVGAVAREHGLGISNRPSPTGWCSWYQFFQEINPELIRSNLEAVKQLQKEIPLDLVQIDDGFEAQVGDWLSFHPAFPDGIAPLAAEIRAGGLTPGLWLAPFIIHPKSRLAAEHPDWLLRGHLNRPVNAGYLWNTFTTALDLTHPQALAYAREVIQTATQRWGFPYLKLDFLFAAALPGRRHDPTRTRAQVLRAALEEVRAAAGEETMLLGCGCPLGPAIGLVDAMRVSSDVDVGWRPAFKGKKLFFQSEPHMPSARNALQNILTRAPLHQRWWLNDPDCLLLRPETNLTLDEVQTLASVIALSGGSLFLSDHLPSLPVERLRIAEALLPLIGQAPRLPDWLDSHTPSRLRLDLENTSGVWHLLAFINWEDQAQEIYLDLADFGLDPRQHYHAREFWRGTAGIIEEGRFRLGSLAAHGTALAAVRPWLDGAPQYLGSDLHVSQGLEVTAWESLPLGLSLRIQRPGRVRGSIQLKLPHQPETVICNGLPVPCELKGETCLLQLESTELASIELTWRQ